MMSVAGLEVKIQDTISVLKTSKHRPPYDIKPEYDIDLCHELKVTVTCTPGSGDFALYLG